MPGDSKLLDRALTLLRDEVLEISALKSPEMMVARVVQLYQAFVTCGAVADFVFEQTTEAISPEVRDRLREKIREESQPAVEAIMRDILAGQLAAEVDATNVVPILVKPSAS